MTLKSQVEYAGSFLAEVLSNAIRMSQGWCSVEAASTKAVQTSSRIVGCEPSEAYTGIDFPAFLECSAARQRHANGPDVAPADAAMRVFRRADKGTRSPWLAILGSGLMIVLMLIPARVLAQGGPPLITDDPDTPGPGYWEINLSGILEKTRSERQWQTPLADINYGLGRRIQLKLEVPWLYAREPEERAQTGVGNPIVGVKWRFVGQEGKRLAWSTYPQLEVNNGRPLVEKALLNDGWQFFLPTELTVQVARYEINGEIGKTFVQQGDNGWMYGLSSEIEIHQRFELLGEVHGQRSGPSSDFIVEVGGRQKLTRQMILLMAAGRSVHGRPAERLNLRLYVGLQFNLPRQYEFSSQTHP